jgi:CRP-like cAMP-binding protein
LAAIENKRPVQPAIPAEESKTLKMQLTEHPFLRGMSSQQIGTLAGAAMQAHMTAGQLIFREGEMANRFYLIQHGKVLRKVGL